MSDSYTDTLEMYVDHSATYETLMDNLIQYSDEGHADFQATRDLAKLLSEKLSKSEIDLPGAGPYFVGLTFLLLGFKDLNPSDKGKHRKVIKRLLDEVS